MKSVLKHIGRLVFLVLLANTAFAGAPDSTMSAATARSWEEKALANYKQSPDSGIYYFKVAGSHYAQAKNYKAAAASLQNAAFVSADLKNDYYKAGELMKESQQYWKMTSDKKALAESYRYAVTVHAKINDNINVRRKGDTAIMYLSGIKDNKGIAQVNLTIAGMYDAQRGVDSMMKFAGLAEESAKKMPKNDPAVLSINNSLLRLYVNNERMNEAKAILKKSQKQIEKGAISKDEKLNYYYNAWIYNTKAGDAKAAEETKAKYDALKNTK